MTAPLIDSLVAAVASRPAGSPPADAVVQVLVAAIDPAGLPESSDGFRAAVEDAENRITAVLAAEADSAATPAMRAHAIQLVGLVRLANSEEVRLRVASRRPAWTAANELKAILWSAAEAVNRAY
jgi:hypothetical protein